MLNNSPNTQHNPTPTLIWASRIFKKLRGGSGYCNIHFLFGEVWKRKEGGDGVTNGNGVYFAMYFFPANLVDVFPGIFDFE